VDGDGDGDGDGRGAGNGRPAGVRGDDREDDEGLAVCRAIRSADTAHAREVPVVVMDRQEDEAAGAAAEVTDWLVEPFTPVYARTRVRAWLLRAGCRWERAPIPPDEPRRLAALRRLNLLDTPAEERFDRLTRLAAAAFGVPTAFVTLVDEDRQWLKSCVGSAIRETGRDVSFCAHAILGPDVLVVPDALLDPRFADNPLVTGGPRIRFYAGYPLVLPGGSCVGTLCVVDTRPREFSDADVALFRDLGNLVRQELVNSGKVGQGAGTPD
jgi:CheY-like chemotaxis protein